MHAITTALHSFAPHTYHHHLILGLRIATVLAMLPLILVYGRGIILERRPPIVTISFWLTVSLAIISQFAGVLYS
jgi:hypothetical protein